MKQFFKHITLFFTKIIFKFLDSIIAIFRKDHLRIAMSNICKAIETKSLYVSYNQ